LSGISRSGDPSCADARGARPDAQSLTQRPSALREAFNRLPLRARAAVCLDRLALGGSDPAVALDLDDVPWVHVAVVFGISGLFSLAVWMWGRRLEARTSGVVVPQPAA
jgi:hypothetical protein